jgi:hypothetical protein
MPVMESIQALIQQNLAVEAKALIELVCERYAGASMRLDALTVSAAAHSGTPGAEEQRKRQSTMTQREFAEHY